MQTCDRCFKQATSRVPSLAGDKDVCDRCRSDLAAFTTAFFAAEAASVDVPDVQQAPVVSDPALTTVNVKADVTPQPMPVERAPIV